MLKHQIVSPSITLCIIISSAVGLHRVGNVQIASCFQMYALRILTIVTMEAHVLLTAMARNLYALVETTT